MVIRPLLLIIVLGSTLLACNDTGDVNDVRNEIIQIEYPETYALSNIVLALTPYGQNDPWQVRKDFPYYDTMMAHFAPFSNHPLIDTVNYSRPRWKEYLSFRTDAYAFSFDDNGVLVRTSDFQSFDVTPFDDHLDLIEDFARVSGFRAYFQAQAGYRKGVVNAYRNQYMLEDMRDFLSDEFGAFFSEKEYKVVLSPFVYAQNLHRDIDSLTTADFPTLPPSIVLGRSEMSEEELAREVHTLFTEMDHGYVDPTTARFDELVTASFDEALWADDSGYEGYSNAVFNEYMTWAVYDLFVQQFFPEYAEEMSLYWHFQNASRGFPYSYHFAQKLKQLYQDKAPGQQVSDLYPDLLAWTKTEQRTLSKPTLAAPADTLFVPFREKTAVVLQFSNPMQKVTSFTMLLRSETGRQDTVEVGQTQNLLWSEDGTRASFNVDLPAEQRRATIILNWWGTRMPLMKPDGVLLASPSVVRLVNED